MTQSPNGAPLLRVDALHVRFVAPHGEVRAVDGVSLQLLQGRRLGVVGESGSGKTQTFSSLFGLSEGSPGIIAGRAQFNDMELLDGLDRFVYRAATETQHQAGQVLKDVPGWNRHHQAQMATLLGRDVAMMFQDPRRALIPYWTIERHLRDVLARRNQSDAPDASPAATLAALGFRDTARILGSYPEQLSGGEAQRALLAISVAMRPQLLVADEPTTGLDTVNQVRALDALLQAHASGTFALVLISHDLAVVDAMVDDIVVMFAGRVVERAPAALIREAADDGVHPYTSALRESQRRRAIGDAINPTAYKERLERSPHGCAYHARCPLKPRLAAAAQHRCASEAPSLEPVGDGHAVACWERVA